MGLGFGSLGRDRDDIEVEESPDLFFCEKRLRAFEAGERPSAADGREARRLWLITSRGQFWDDDEREFCETVFLLRPQSAPAEWYGLEVKEEEKKERKEEKKEEKEIPLPPLPVRDWSAEVNIDVAANIVTNLYEDLANWKPKMNRISRAKYLRKDWNKMAQTTKEVYSRKLKSIDAEIREGKYTDTDILCMLLATAHKKSRSTFFAERALLQRWAIEHGREELARLVNSLPEWAELKKRFGEHPKYISEKTRERQRTDITAATLSELCRNLPAARNQNLAPVILFLSGARVSELPSVNIFTNPDGSAVIRVETKKLGCANKSVPQSRRIEYAAGTKEARQLSAISAAFGRAPFEQINIATFRSNWRAARKKIEKKNPEVSIPDIHTFRHAFSTAERQRVAVEMKHFYGSKWREDADKREYAKKELARKLGHSSPKTSQVYGRR